jgi:hypothetical protein
MDVKKISWKLIFFHICLLYLLFQKGIVHVISLFLLYLSGIGEIRVLFLKRFEKKIKKLTLQYFVAVKTFYLLELLFHWGIGQVLFTTKCLLNLFWVIWESMFEKTRKITIIFNKFNIFSFSSLSQAKWKVTQ